MASGRSIASLVIDVRTDVGLALNGLQSLFNTIRDGISEFAQFETGIREVGTLLGQEAVAGGFIQEAQEGAQQLAFEFGTLTNTSIPALYQAISARVPQANAFSFLEEANKLAIAGVTDLDTSVRGIVAAINAYGTETLSAAEASDSLFVGVRYGITTVEQLSNNIGQVTPLAANLGVSFDEVVASLAAMTAQGVSTAQASTRLNAVLTELSRESSDVSGVFRELTGQSFPEFIAAGGSLAEAIQVIEEEAKRTDTTMVDMFNRIEAGQGVMLLSGESAGLFEDALGGMADKAGETDKAFETMAESLQFHMNQLFAGLEQVRLSFFEGFGPPVVELIEGILPTIEGLLPVFEELGVISGESFGLVGSAVFGVIEAMSGPLLDTLQIVSDFLRTAAEAMTPFIDAVGGLGAEVLAGLVPGLSALAEMLGTVLTAASPLVTLFATVFGNLLAETAVQISNLLTPLSNLVGGFLELHPAILAGIAGAGILATAFTNIATQSAVASAGVTRLSIALSGLQRASLLIATITTIATVFSLLRDSADESALSMENVADTINNLRTGDSVADVTSAVVEFSDAMDQAAERANDEQGGLGAGLGRIRDGFVGLVKDVVSVQGVLADWDGLAEASASSSELQAQAVQDLRDSFTGLDEELATIISSGDGAAFNEVLDGIAESSDLSKQEIRELADDILPSATEAFEQARNELFAFGLQAEVNVGQFETMRDALGLTNEEILSFAEQAGPGFADAMQRIIDAEEQGLESTAQLDQSLLDLAGQMGATGEGAQQAAKDTIQAWQTMAEGIAPVGQIWGDVMTEMEERGTEFAETLAGDLDLDLGELESALAGGKDDFFAYAEEAEISTGQAKTAWKEYEESVAVSLSDVNESLSESVEAVQNFNENMLFAAQVGGQDFAEFLGNMGPEAMQAFREGTNAERDETIALYEEYMLATGEGAKAALTLGLADMQEITGLKGEEAANALLRGINKPEEMTARAQQLSNILGNGFSTVAQLAETYGQQTAQNLVTNLAEGRQLSNQQLQLLRASTDTNLINWAQIAETRGTGFATNLRTTLAQGRALSDEQLGALRRNTSTDMSQWAGIATTQGQKWKANLDQKLAEGRIDFSQYAGALERMARQTDADVETEVERPAQGAMQSVFNSIASFFGLRDVDVPTSLNRPPRPNWAFDVGYTVGIPTRFLPPTNTPGNANGGIYDSPLLTWVGEANQKEVILPLERPVRAQALAEEAGLFDVVTDPRTGRARNASIEIGSLIVNAVDMDELDPGQRDIQVAINTLITQFYDLAILLEVLQQSFQALNVAVNTERNLMNRLGWQGQLGEAMRGMILRTVGMRTALLNGIRDVNRMGRTVETVTETLKDYNRLVQSSFDDFRQVEPPSRPERPSEPETPDRPQSALLDYVERFLKAVRNGATFFEDFTSEGVTFRGDLNEQLVDLFYNQFAPGFDFGGPGTEEKVEDFLESLLNRSTARIAQVEAQSSTPQRVVNIEPGAINVQTNVSDPELVAEQVMNRFAALGA